MIKFLSSDVFKVIRNLLKYCKGENVNFYSTDKVLSVRPVKVLLSHNMTGLDEEYIMNLRRVAKKYLEKKYGQFIEIEYIDNYHHYDAPINANRIWHLGKSIQQLSEADFVYFCEPRANSSGCIIEKIICLIYHKPVLK